MSSIFDGITVPGAGITPGTNGGRGGPGGGLGVAATAAASGVVVASTGLVATVEPGEFIRLVRDAVDPVVLHVQSMQGAGKPGERPAPPRAVHRYTMSCAGILFITQSGSSLDVPSGTRVVECTGILFEGKPIA